MIPGILKLAALVFAFLLAVFLAFQLLEINMDFSLGSLTCKYKPSLFHIYYNEKHQMLYHDVFMTKLPTFPNIFEYFWVFQPELCHKTKSVSIYFCFHSIVLDLLANV